MSIKAARPWARAGLHFKGMTLKSDKLINQSYWLLISCLRSYRPSDGGRQDSVLGTTEKANARAKLTHEGIV